MKVTVHYEKLTETEFRKRLLKWIGNVEGNFQTGYNDTKNHPSIGVGFDLTVASVRNAVFNIMGIDPSSNVGVSITKAINGLTGKSRTADQVNDALSQAYGQPFTMTDDQIVTVFNNISNKYIDAAKSLSGLDFSTELLAFTSAQYNGVVGPNAAAALTDSDPYEARAEAWYQIRYVHKDENQSRRYQEAALFGLYDRTNGVTDSVSVEEALGVYKMYTKEATVALAGASGGMAAYDNSKSRYRKYANDQVALYDPSLAVGSLSGALRPAAQALLQAAFAKLPTPLVVDLNPLNLKVSGDHQVTYTDKDRNGNINETITVKFDGAAEHVTVVNSKGRSSAYDVNADGTSVAVLTDANASTTISYSDQKVIDHAERYDMTGAQLASVWDSDGDFGVSTSGGDLARSSGVSSRGTMTSSNDHPSLIGTVKSAGGEITADISYGNNTFVGAANSNHLSYESTGVQTDRKGNDYTFHSSLNFSQGTASLNEYKLNGNNSVYETTSVTADQVGMHALKVSQAPDVPNIYATTTRDELTVNNDGSLEWDFRFANGRDLTPDANGNKYYEEYHIKVSSDWQVQLLTDERDGVLETYHPGLKAFSTSSANGSDFVIQNDYDYIVVHRSLSGVITGMGSAVGELIVSTDGNSFVGGNELSSVGVGTLGSDAGGDSDDRVYMSGGLGTNYLGGPDFTASNTVMSIQNHSIGNSLGLGNGIDSLTLGDARSSVSQLGSMSGDLMTQRWVTDDGNDTSTTKSYGANGVSYQIASADQTPGIVDYDVTNDRFDYAEYSVGSEATAGESVFTKRVEDGLLSTYKDTYGNVLHTDINFDDGSRSTTQQLANGGTTTVNFSVDNIKSSSTDQYPDGSTKDTYFSIDGSTSYIEFTGTAADETVTGSDGNDFIASSGGDDFLIGGKGDDHLEGGDGVDTYIFAKGDGHDTVSDVSGENNTDIKIKFATGISESDISLAQDDNDLIFNYSSGADSVNLEDWFDTGTDKSTRLAFDDGTSLNLRTGTADSDYLYGTDGDDYFAGGGGDNIFIGVAGRDTYYVSKSDGADQIAFGDTADDTLRFDSAIAVNDVTVSRDIDSLYLNVANGPSVLLGGWFDPYGTRLGDVQFSDGTVWNESDLLAKVAVITDGDDLYTGTEGNDLIDTRAGNDWVDGGGGNDTIIGGAGDDTLTGGTGNDTFIFSNNSGHDTILADYTQDTDYIQFDADVSSSAVTISASFPGLTLSWNDGQSDVTLSDWFFEDSAQNRIVKFADGTEWDSNYLWDHLTSSGGPGGDPVFLRSMPDSDIASLQGAGEGNGDVINASYSDIADDAASRNSLGKYIHHDSYSMSNRSDIGHGSDVANDLSILAARLGSNDVSTVYLAKPFQGENKTANSIF